MPSISTFPGFRGAAAFLRRHPGAALFALLVPLYFTWTFDHSLWNPDETRDAGIAREMYVERGFVVPRLNGEPFLEKPPLYYWACTAVYAVTGGRVTAGTTRLPAALFGLLGIGFTFLFARRFFSDGAAVFSALVLATSVQYFRMSHFALMDTSLAAFVTGSLYFYFTGRLALSSLFALLAFYAKGAVGLALPGIVMATDLALKKDFRSLFRVAAIAGGIAIAGAAPWIYALWRKGGGSFLHIFFVDNTWNRFFSGGADHQAPFYFYVVSFPADVLPWTALIAAALLDRSSAPPEAERNALRFLRVWAASIFVLLSASGSKRSIYLLPMFPAVAILTGVWLDRALRGPALAAGWRKNVLVGTYGTAVALGLAAAIAHGVRHRAPVSALMGVAVFAGLAALARRDLKAGRGVAFGVNLGVAIATVIAIAGVFFVRDLDRDKSFLPLIDQVRRQGPDAVVAGFDMSEMERGVFSFYLKRTIPNPATAPALEDFLREHQSVEVVLMANRNKTEALKPVLLDRLQLIGAFRPDKKTRSYLLLSNRPVPKPS